MTSEMTAPQGHTMAVIGERASATPLVFTEEQRRIIRDTYANGASDSEFAVLMEVAKTRRLNPLLRQIHFVKRWTPKGDVWTVQAAIDGLRAIAERTGLYAGQDEPEFTEDDGGLKFCKVRVYRKDWPRPAVGIAYFSEYVQTTRDKQTGKTRPNEMWGRMPHTMLAKCAEALALRKAFPEDMGGLYTGDEMGQAENGRAEVVDAEAAGHEVFAEERAETSATTALDDLIASVGACQLPGDVVQRWVASAEDRREWSADEVDAVRSAMVQRVAHLQKADPRAARTWLAKAIAEATKPTTEPAGILGAIESAGDIAAVRTELLRSLTAYPAMSDALWSTATARAKALGVDEDTLRRMVREAQGDGDDTPPDGPQGGRARQTTGSHPTANGKGAGGAATGDGARALTLVSDAAQGLLERNGRNPWALRNAIRKHRDELDPQDVEELARVLAAITPADEHGARLTQVSAERIVRGLSGLGPANDREAAA